MITNSGSQRFNIYAGPFTKNDQLTVSPFDDSFLYIPNIPFSVANKVLPALNFAGANEKRDLLEEREKTFYGRGHVDLVYNRWLEEQDSRDGIERRAAQNLTLGYVTKDVMSFPYPYPIFSLIFSPISLARCWRRHPPCSLAILHQPGLYRFRPPDCRWRRTHWPCLCQFHRNSAVGDSELDAECEDLQYSWRLLVQPHLSQWGSWVVCASCLELILGLVGHGSLIAPSLLLKLGLRVSVIVVQCTGK